MVKALQSNFSVIRYAAAKCIATACSVITVQGMTMLVEKVLPMISNPLDLHCRQGAIETVYRMYPHNLNFLESLTNCPNRFNSRHGD